MKSLLVLLAVASTVSLIALAQSGQSGVGSANTVSAAGSPAPDAAAPAFTGTAADSGPAASSVPLPGQPAGPALEKNLPLIPEMAPGSAGQAHSGKGRKAGAHASPGSSPTNTFDVEQGIRVRISMRKAATIALNDPSVHADWVAAHNTRTDPQRREALTTYFNHLYNRMIQIDPSIATHANARRAASIARMHYGRLGDLDYGSLGNFETDYDPFATPAPEGRGKNPPSADEPPSP